MVKQVLTIAGSDSTGGAGLEADLKTFQEFGLYGYAVITSIVTMDASKGWQHEVHELDSELIQKQFASATCGDQIAALKTGMLGNEENAATISKLLKTSNIEKIVIDPVIACKGTANILQPQVVEMLKNKLIPQAFITTPNLVEAGILSGMGDLHTVEQMKQAAKIIHEMGAKNVVIKGGARLNHELAIDIFYDGQDFQTLALPIISTATNHGAGCTFAAAITSLLAHDYPVLQAVQLAKSFVNQAIQKGIFVNPYVGHVWHGAYFHAETRLEESK